MECPYCFKKFKLKSRYQTHVQEQICFKYMNKSQKEELLQKQSLQKETEEIEEIEENPSHNESFEAFQKLVWTQLEEERKKWMQERTELYKHFEKEISQMEENRKRLLECIDLLKMDNNRLIQRFNEEYARDVKVRKTDRERGELMTDMVISILLNSPLNITSLPDDMERLLYISIINTLAEFSSSVCTSWSFFKRGK